MDTPGVEALTVGERLRLRPRLGEEEEGKPSRIRVSQFRPSATMRRVDGSRGCLRTTEPLGSPLDFPKGPFAVDEA